MRRTTPQAGNYTVQLHALIIIIFHVIRLTARKQINSEEKKTKKNELTLKTQQNKVGICLPTIK